MSLPESQPARSGLAQQFFGHRLAFQHQLKQVIVAVRGRFEQVTVIFLRLLAYFSGMSIRLKVFLVHVLKDEFHTNEIDDALEPAARPAGSAQMAGTTPSFSFICSMQAKKSEPMRSSLLM